MRISDQDYFRSCIAKERQLAHAHSAILLAGQPVEEIL